MADNTHSDSKNIPYLKERGADVQNYLDIVIAIAVEEDEAAK